MLFERNGATSDFANGQLARDDLRLAVKDAIPNLKERLSQLRESLDKINKHVRIEVYALAAHQIP